MPSRNPYFRRAQRCRLRCVFCSYRMPEAPLNSTPRAIVRTDTLAAWTGPSLLVVTRDGECRHEEPLSGYYFREARFLSSFRLTVDRETPWLCEAASLSPSRLAFTYVYPEIAEFGGGGSGSADDETPTNRRGIPQRALAIEM